MFKYKNGVKAKSAISGFSGMIVARSNHLYGCNRYFLAPSVTKDKPAELPDGYWFDEGEIITDEVVTIKPDNKDTGGFPSRLK
jgi:hypothetical protein